MHARRSGILPEEYRTRIITSERPQSVGTFLVDGAVAGEWQLQDGHVMLTPYEEIDAGSWLELRREAERLAAFCA